MVAVTALCPAQQSRNQSLGAGDMIAVRALHVPEMPEKPLRVGDDGGILLPMIGRIQASGLTTSQLAAEIRRRLEPVIRDPQVSVELVEQKSHPVSVLGAVKAPGLYQLEGEKRLLDVISRAGGLDQDAGYSLRISRLKSAGPLPIPGATESGEYRVAEVHLEDVMEARKPELNIVILPQDTIAVPRGRLVYVVGQVRKPGGFVLREREQMSVLQAISLAEGFTATAGAGGARILREQGEDGKRIEIPVNVSKILAGRASDTPLRANDILFVPNSAPKSATLRAIDSAIQMGTGVVIWRR
jgi:polysaccharide export outer membrane protein